MGMGRIAYPTVWHPSAHDVDVEVGAGGGSYLRRWKPIRPHHANGPQNPRCLFEPQLSMSLVNLSHIFPMPLPTLKS